MLTTDLKDAMSAAEIMEARARAELEMFYLMTVEGGVTYLAWCESQTRQLPDLRRYSETYTRPGSAAHPSGGRRAAGGGRD